MIHGLTFLVVHDPLLLRLWHILLFISRRVAHEWISEHRDQAKVVIDEWLQIFVCSRCNLYKYNFRMILTTVCDDAYLSYFLYLRQLGDLMKLILWCIDFLKIHY